MTTLALPWSAHPDTDTARAPGWWARWQARRDERRDDAIDEWLHRRDILDLAHRWRAAAPRAGLCEVVSTTLGGVGPGHAPRVTHVVPATPDRDGYLIVELAPGTTLADLDDGCPELAAALGAWSLRFTPRADRWVRVDMLRTDPLAVPVQLAQLVSRAPAGHIVFGVDERDELVSLPVHALPHMAWQGATGSGKTTLAYGVLAQLAQRARTAGDVDLLGIDPGGILLRPWGAHPQGWRVTGTADANARYEIALAGIVDELDRRVAAIPARSDVLPLGREWPLLLCALEEWPATGRLVGHTRSRAAATHRLAARIGAEGRKVGVRLLTMAQRLDSDVVDPGTREQADLRVTLGSPSRDTLTMLHGTVEPELVGRLASNAPGVGVLQLPGSGLVRFRAPQLDYADYVDAVTANNTDGIPSACLPGQAA